MHVTMDYAEGDRTRIRIENHFWPVPDTTPIIDRNKVLTRYIGRRATIKVGSRYLVDPKTHRHKRCDPIYRQITAGPDDFQISAGPILVCGDGVADMREGAVVSLRRWVHGESVFDELPAAFDAGGTSLGKTWIAPALRTPDSNDIMLDKDTCAPR